MEPMFSRSYISLLKEHSGITNRRFHPFSRNFYSLRPPKPLLSPEMIEKAEQELGARNRNDSLQVLFEQAKRIEAPSFIPGDNVNLRPGNERTMNLFKKGHLGGPLQKSVSSPILNDISQVPEKNTNKSKRSKR